MILESGCEYLLKSVLNLRITFVIVMVFFKGEVRVVQAKSQKSSKVCLIRPLLRVWVLLVAILWWGVSNLKVKVGNFDQ